MNSSSNNTSTEQYLVMVFDKSTGTKIEQKVFNVLSEADIFLYTERMKGHDTTLYKQQLLTENS